ncbi:hypothetical protein ACI65C_004372 [Semiaphis heraclei]
MHVCYSSTVPPPSIRHYHLSLSAENKRIIPPSESLRVAVGVRRTSAFHRWGRVRYVIRRHKTRLLTTTIQQTTTTTLLTLSSHYLPLHDDVRNTDQSFVSARWPCGSHFLFVPLLL